MGYSTEFSGQFAVMPALRPEHIAYLKAFNHTRRMKRSMAIARLRPDPLRQAVRLPIGAEGEYFVGGNGSHGQEFAPFGPEASDVLDSNRPPATQPGLWCQWRPTDDGAAIKWDGGEKFYDYVEWIEYLLANFLTPWGYSVQGDVRWQGEDAADRGVIHVETNRVSIMPLPLRRRA